MMLLIAWGKPFGLAWSMPAGWTSLGSGASGTTAAGIDIGSMKAEVWYKEATSDTEANPTLTEGSPVWNVVQACIMVFSKDAAEAWDVPQVVYAADEVTGTALSFSFGTNPGGTAGDYIVLTCGINADGMGPLTTDLAATWTGITFGTYDTAVEAETTSGGDMAAHIRSVPVSTGTASANPSMTGTGTATGGADRAEGALIRLRVSAASNRAYDQAGFRGYADDAPMGSATPKANENVGWSQIVDQNFRTRFVVDETAGGTLSAVLDFKLQYRKNGGTWTDVNTTSTNVRTFTGSVANGTATSRLLSSGTGTFVAGTLDSNNGAAGSANTIESGELTELEFITQIRSADVVQGDTIELRVVETTGSVVFGAYSQTPSLTANEPAILVINDATHSHAAEELGLTQHHVLTVQDAIHGHTTDDLDLIQHYVLAIEDAIHTHAADNLTLTEGGSIALEIQDGAHAHVADNLALVQNYVLAIQDALHAQSADNLVLIQHYILVLQDAIHDHTADNLALTQHNILVTQDALHAHSSDNATLNLPGEEPEDTGNLIRMRRRRGIRTL
jgi:hypothetical protein